MAAKMARCKVVGSVVRKEDGKMVEKEKIGSEMMELIQTSMDVTMDAVTLMQEQTERFLSILLDQGMLAQQEGRKFLSDWTGRVKDGREKFRKSLEESLKKAEGFFSKGQ